MGPRGRGSELGEQLLFADLEGYVGAFDNVYPPETTSTNQMRLLAPPPGPVFSEKIVEKCHAPFQSSSTLEHLQHRFMVSCQALIIHVYMMLYIVYMLLLVLVFRAW